MTKDDVSKALALLRAKEQSAIGISNIAIGQDGREAFAQIACNYRDAADVIQAFSSILAHIISDLPTNRDWLDPQLEKLARMLIEEKNNVS